jgi:hypothetical protein
MRLEVIADIHGNDVAVRTILQDADRLVADCWWALGELVLFGPRPAEVLDLLRGLPGISMLRGNSDRYVLTGEQPAPHATAADSARSIDLVERFAAMMAGIAWTRGCRAGPVEARPDGAGDVVARDTPIGSKGSDDLQAVIVVGLNYG